MFKLTILFAVIALSASTPVTKVSLRPRLEDLILRNRIVGGFVLPIELAPYQVSLQHGVQHICGGSIIAENWILTAAHCTDGSSASQLSIRAGTSTRGSGGNVIQVKRIVQHEQYNHASIDFDFSLLELATNVTLTADKQIVPLPDIDHSLFGKKWCLVSGWGNTQSSDESSKLLRGVFVPIVDQEQCHEAYADFGGVTEQMLCAGFTSGGKDACQGDSGGPLVNNGILAGVVSWGYGCAKPDYPGVYSRVSAVRAWIAENTSV